MSTQLNQTSEIIEKLEADIKTFFNHYVDALLASSVNKRLKIFTEKDFTEEARKECWFDCLSFLSLAREQEEDLLEDINLADAGRWFLLSRNDEPIGFQDAELWKLHNLAKTFGPVNATPKEQGIELCK